MREDIIAFSKNDRNTPFFIEMCGKSYCDGTYRINRPKSRIYCIEYVYKGTGFVRSNDAEFSPCEGDVYILPAGENHNYYSDSGDPWEKIWFNIKGELVEKTIDAYNLKGVYHIKNTDVASLFENFVRNAEFIRREGKTEYNFDVCALDFLKIIQSLSKHIRTEKAQCLPSFEEKLRKRIESITDFSMSFDEILNDFYYTKSHIIRVFKKKYKITPYEYFLERKISAAKMLMLNTAMTIKEISDYLGFSDCHYFSNFFKKRTGISPREYRNKE